MAGRWGKTCRAAVPEICRRNHRAYAATPGHLGLIERWLDGRWDQADSLVVPPGRRIIATYGDAIIALED